MYRLKKLLVFIKCINLFYKDNEEEKFKVSAKTKPITPPPPKKKQQKHRKNPKQEQKKPEQRV